MSRDLEPLRRSDFDLLVIGGGITGAGIALDATLRGLRVALIDKGDFASGTSSASSKLIHGGLRYLEHAEFGLVREALRERHILLRIAPHLVRPLRILIPHYESAARPRWMIKLGLSLYDWLAGRERIGRHRPLAAAELVDQVPGLRAEGLKSGFEFFDAQMDDARLCLEVVLSAVAAGARAANYLEAVDLQYDRNGQACGCEVVDRQSGECFAITARRIVNAAGPWLDEVCHIDNSTAPQRLATTKGTHIVLPGNGLAAGLLITHPDDARVMFVLPWMNRTLIGTTDTFCNDRPDDVAAMPEDAEYLLRAANYYLGRSFTNRDVIATLSGLRPLLRQNKADPSSVSREFAIFRSKSGLWSIAGGKYTTYRSMAAHMVDRIADDLGGPIRGIPCGTENHRLIGTPAESWAIAGPQLVEQLLCFSNLARESSEHLVDRYGCRARAIAEWCQRDSELSKPITSEDHDIWAEFPFQTAQEFATCSADHLLRRTRLGLFHPELLEAHLKFPNQLQSVTLSRP